MGNVRPLLSFRLLFMIAAAATTATATGARNPANLDRFELHRITHKGKLHKRQRQRQQQQRQQQRKHLAFTTGGSHKHFAEFSNNNRATVLEVAYAGHVFGRYHSKENHSHAHAHNATGELDEGRIMGARARLKEQQEVLGSDCTPNCANKSKTGSWRVVDTSPAISLLVEKENLTADNGVSGGTFATSSDGNRGAQKCCKCFQAVYENGEIWREARNKKSGALFGRKYGPVLCYAKADNKACYTASNVILTWSPPDSGGLDSCEKLDEGCTKKQLTEDDGKRLWPSKLEDCLKDSEAEDIFVYCTEARLQANSTTSIGHVDGESRTCTGAKKTVKVVKKTTPQSKEPKPTKKQPDNSDEEFEDKPAKQPSKSEEGEDDPFKAAKKHKKSSAPATMGWTVAWALPAFFAARATASTMHFGT